jgi:methyl-accepting chemotaxis protein
VADLLARWAAFGGVQRRIVDNLAGEITRASRDMEQETSALVGAFQALAVKAEAQSERVDRLSHLAETVEVEGEALALDQITALFDQALGDITAKVDFLSRHAVPVVHALDAVVGNLERITLCIGQVDAINRQTKMLAINARIEAVRVGDAGAAFGVVASEISELSRSTEALATTMRAQLAEVADSVAGSHQTLQQVEAIDVGTGAEARVRLGQLIQALAGRHAGMGEIVAEAAVDGADIARRISEVVTGMQFQDRVAQHLEQVTDTLRVLGDASAELQDDSAGAIGPGGARVDQDTAWLKHLIGRYRLSGMRAAFVSAVIEGRVPADGPADPEPGGLIELF